MTDEKQALLFDKNDGHFVCKLGHYGNDPSDMLLRKSGFRDMTERFVSGAGKMSGCGMICRDSFREC